MIYKGKFSISKEDYEYYKKLLDLDFNTDKKEMEKLGAKIYDYIEIGCVEFSNGNYLTIDLCSGCSNYFDNVVLYDMYGTEIDVLDCNYEIGSFETDYGNDMYIVEMEMLK